MQQARQKIRESSGETVRVPVIPQQLNQGIVSKPPQKPTFNERQPSVETADDDEAEEYFYEDEENPGQVEVKTTIKPKDENKPVILTSNFFLPGKPVPSLQQQQDLENQEPNDLSSDIGEVSDQNKDNAEDVIDALPEDETEGIVERTTKTVVEKPKTASNTPKPNKQQIKPVTENPDIEYEYEYVDYDETTTETKNTLKPAMEEHEHEREHEHTTIHVDDEEETTHDVPEPDVTVKSDIKSVKSSTNTNTSSGTSSSTSVEQIEGSIEPVETSSASTTETAENTVDSTEGFVVASVQTSRSISGARFLTFPQVEQEEKRQVLGDVKGDKHEDYEHESNADDSSKADDLVKSIEDESSTTKEDDSTEASEENVPHSKLNESETSRPEVAKSKTHKLSSISEKLAHLHELNEPKPDVTTKSVPVVIRKFSPRTTKTPTRKTTTTSKKPNVEIDDELASLLPPGFIYRANSIKETTLTMASSTTPTVESESSTEVGGATKDEKSIGDEAKDPIIDIVAKRIQFKEISIDDLLPKDYKPTGAEKAMNLTKTANESDLMSKIKFDDRIAALLPKDYKPLATKAPFRLSTVTEDVSKLLPPGFKLPKDMYTTKRPFSKTTMDDISKFLPPGYKLSKFTTTEKPESKPDTATEAIASVLNKLSFNTDVSSLLPPGFKSNVTSDDSDSKEKAEPNEKSIANSNGSSPKFIFPKGIGKRPGVRITTPKPISAEGPTPPGITIRKGLPTR